MKNISIDLLLAASVFFLSACSHSSLKADREPAAVSRTAVLPDQPNYQSYYDYADALDLSKADLRLHEGSGSSVYGVIYVDGKPYGALLPHNSSGHLTGETMAWTLSRALGVPELYQAGVFHKFTAADVATYMNIVPRSPIYRNGKILAIKEANRRHLLKEYANDPSQIETVFKRWDQKPNDWPPPPAPQISDDNATLSKTFIMDGSSDTLASLIQCDGPKPSKDRAVRFGGGTTTEYEAARELSSILLIDALTEQWDRFSGGNMQTMLRENQVYFASIDNGGTWGGTRSTETDLSQVTRFDRHVAEQILKMDKFVEKGKSYLGLRTEADFLSAFDIAESPLTYHKDFVPAIKLTAAWIRAHRGCYF